MLRCVMRVAILPTAVLTDRFAKINDLAEVEWRLVNAKLVKEHFESTVLPTPFNAFEYVAEMVCTPSQL